MNLFVFLPLEDSTRLGLKLTSLSYGENSALPNPGKKSIIKL